MPQCILGCIGGADVQQRPRVFWQPALAAGRYSCSAELGVPTAIACRFRVLPPGAR